MKPENLYSKDNNIFQSEAWLSFLENYGRKIVRFGKFSGYSVSLPFGRTGVIAQKAPEGLDLGTKTFEGLSRKTVFVRLEPVTAPDIAELGHKIRKVGDGSLLSGQKSPKATRVLDISKEESELLSEMKSKTRYNIKLSEKKGVRVSRTNSTDDLYAMLVATSQKGGGYFPHEKKYYENLLSVFAGNDMVNVFVAKKDGRTLAAILVSCFGETATYLHGGQSDAERNLMAPYLCQWEAIKYAKNKGCKYYDFWGVAETDDPKDPWAGISRFKEGFGGDKLVFPGAFDYVLSPFWYNLLTVFARLRHLVR